MTEERLLASYGRRKGRKLRTHAKTLYDDLLPTLTLTLPLEKQTRECWLEIGFGGGEHLAYVASLHPDTDFIGCEPYVNGITGLLKQIETECLENIRIYNDDVRKLLETAPDHSFSRCYILYPDPWPKARHHKRRLIQKLLLDQLARTLKPGAELRIATDWEDYATWIFEQLLPHPAFNWTAKTSADWLNPWDEWISTRYEQKALAEGRTPTYLRFTRNRAT